VPEIHVDHQIVFSLGSIHQKEKEKEKEEKILNGVHNINERLIIFNTSTFTLNFAPTVCLCASKLIL
jgi:hypothetical protein